MGVIRELTTAVAKRLGFKSRAAYERAVIRRAVMRDARRLGLLTTERKRPNDESGPAPDRADPPRHHTHKGAMRESHDTRSA